MTDIDQLDSIGAAAYVIEEIGGDPEETFENLQSFKKTTKRACPRLNSPNQVLYVGSSVTGLKKRILEHIGKGSESTSALHLGHWFGGEFQITVCEYHLPRNVIQIV